jgi:hypothetical protein
MPHFDQNLRFILPSSSGEYTDDIFTSSVDRDASYHSPYAIYFHHEVVRRKRSHDRRRRAGT